MFVAVGSASNVDDPDTTPAEKNRADILEFNPDGSAMRVYAYGIRNAGGGWRSIRRRASCGVRSTNATAWATIWCRITSRMCRKADFMAGRGGTWAAIRIRGTTGKHPELKDKVIMPDVLLQPHNASLELTFYEGKQFPAEYQGDIFASRARLVEQIGRARVTK